MSERELPLALEMGDEKGLSRAFPGPGLSVLRKECSLILM